MSADGRNIYQTARKSAGYTQEAAAELLDVSVESLSAYENDRRIPPERVVVLMVEYYHDRLLAYQHMKQNMELAADMLLPIPVTTNLSSAVLRLQKEVNDFMRCRERLIEITCNGMIDAKERQEFNLILKKLNDICSAILTLQYAKEDT